MDVRIGVFDSGIGGKSVANILKVDFPSAQIIYADDRKNVPYGGRKLEDIIYLTDRAIRPLIDAKCDVVVIACNTATTAAIETLRKQYPEIFFIGIEPMIKPAVNLTKSGIVAVCATPFTLSSERYLKLKKLHAAGVAVLEPDCSEWAYMIEHNQINDVKIEKIVTEVCNAGADVIVLACTHYHWIKDRIMEVANGKSIVIYPTEAISKRVRDVLRIMD